MTVQACFVPMLCSRRDLNGSEECGGESGLDGKSQGGEVGVVVYPEACEGDEAMDIKTAEGEKDSDCAAARERLYLLSVSLIPESWVREKMWDEKRPERSSCATGISLFAC